MMGVAEDCTTEGGCHTINVGLRKKMGASLGALAGDETGP